MELKEAIATVEAWEATYRIDMRALTHSAFTVVLDAARSWSSHVEGLLDTIADRDCTIERLRAENETERANWREEHNKAVIQGTEILQLRANLKACEEAYERDVNAERAGRLKADDVLKATQAELAAEKATNARLYESRDAALDELATERSLVARQANIIEVQEKRLKNLEGELDCVRGELHEANDMMSARSTLLAQPVTSDKWKLQLIDHIASGNGEYIGDSEDAIGVIARWEPKP